MEEMKEDDGQFRRFLKDGGFLHYIGMLATFKPDILRYMGRYENLCSLRLAGWLGSLWVIISISAEHRNVMEEVARDFELKIVDGSPLVIEGDGSVNQMMASDNDRIFTLI